MISDQVSTGPVRQAAPPGAANAAPPPLSTRKRIAFSLVVLVVVIGGAELATRTYYRMKTGSWEIPDKYQDWDVALYQPHPYVGYQVAPGILHEQDGVVIESNALGFRGPEVELPKPPGRVRIATLGGSTTFNTKVTHGDATWTARLAARAGARGLDVDWVNGGCPNYTTADSLNNLAFRVLDLEPDLVVVYHSWNDLKCAQHPGFESDYSHWRQIYHRRDPGPFRRLLSSSLIVRKLERNVRRARSRRELRDSVAAERVEMPEAAPRAFERNLRSIVALCRANGVTVALSTFASRESQLETPASSDFQSYYHPHFDAQQMQDGLRLYAELVRELAREEGVLLIDAQREMPLERDREEQLFADSIHFTNLGADVLAGVMDEAIEAQGGWAKLRRKTTTDGDD